MSSTKASALSFLEWNELSKQPLREGCRAAALPRCPSGNQQPASNPNSDLGEIFRNT
ncbi:MAG: hypothetical protein ABGX16_05115 [Pirellulales bacterium]